ncbi:MAG: dihydropteroate synthase [Candidatus Poseidoniia archaeon]
MAVYEDSRDCRMALSAYSNGRPRLMGIINCTPDSFHQDSQHGDLQKALQMLEEGADWIDIGGESTRPGSPPITIVQEINRTITIIKQLRGKSDCFISIDTRHHEVAQAALQAGADMINDVSGLRDPKMFDLVLSSACAVCIMHMKGEPKEMQDDPSYKDVFKEVYHQLIGTARKLVNAGHDPNLIVLDPGIGFGKTLEHNLTLLRDIDRGDDFRILWGTSRKSMFKEICGRNNSSERLAATLATAAQAQKLGVDILRVHDIKEHLDLGKVLAALEERM